VLARQVAELLKAAGHAPAVNACRGLDHGAWVPLRWMYPAHDVPVVQLSVQPSLGTEHHLRVGAALASLADEGVLVIGSGSLTHNLHEFRSRPTGTAPYVREFQDWMHKSIAAKDVAALLDYRKLAPHAVRAHPTDEHLLPLYVALGAGGVCGETQRLTDEVTYGILAMDAYVFRPGLHAAVA
jgi:4,5-DOPA dioxygenase extradiol